MRRKHNRRHRKKDGWKGRVWDLGYSGRDPGEPWRKSTGSNSHRASVLARDARRGLKLFWWEAERVDLKEEAPSGLLPSGFIELRSAKVAVTSILEL